MNIFIKNKKVISAILYFSIASSITMPAIATEPIKISGIASQVAKSVNTQNIGSDIINICNTVKNAVISKVKTFKAPTWKNSKDLIIISIFSALMIMKLADKLPIDTKKNAQKRKKEITMEIIQNALLSTGIYLSSPIALNYNFLSSILVVLILLKSSGNNIHANAQKYKSKEKFEQIAFIMKHPFTFIFKLFLDHYKSKKPKSKYGKKDPKEVNIPANKKNETLNNKNLKSDNKDENTTKNTTHEIKI